MSTPVDTLWCHTPLEVMAPPLTNKADGATWTAAFNTRFSMFYLLRYHISLFPSLENPDTIEALGRFIAAGEEQAQQQQEAHKLDDSGRPISQHMGRIVSTLTSKASSTQRPFVMLMMLASAYPSRWSSCPPFLGADLDFGRQTKPSSCILASFVEKCVSQLGIQRRLMGYFT